MTGAPRSWAASTDFIMIHVDLLDALDGSYAAAALWERIRYRSERDGWWEATRQEMCEETRLSDRVLRRGLEELRDAGLIESERVTPFRPTLRWRVLWADSESAGQPVMDESSSTGEPMDDLTITVEDDSSISLSSETDGEVEPPSTPQAGVDEQQALPLLSVVAADEPQGLDSEFDGFWGAYPRKVGKQAARKAYRAARKVASLDAIAAGLRAQLPDLRTRDLHLVPHPSTWLNQRRWEDDPRAAAQPRGGPRNYDLERMQARAAGTEPEITTGATALALQMLEARR